VKISAQVFLQTLVDTLELNTVSSSGLQIVTNDNQSFNLSEFVITNLSRYPCKYLIAKSDEISIKVTVTGFTTPQILGFSPDILGKNVGEFIAIVAGKLNIAPEGCRLKVNGKIQVKSKNFGELYKMENPNFAVEKPG